MCKILALQGHSNWSTTPLFQQRFEKLGNFDNISKGKNLSVGENSS